MPASKANIPVKTTGDPLNAAEINALKTITDNHADLLDAATVAIAGTVNITDVRLSDARIPLVHIQAASTITGLAAVATTGNYNDLINKPVTTASATSAITSVVTGGVFRGAFAAVAYALYDCIIIPAGQLNAGLFAYATAAFTATATYAAANWTLDPGQSTNDYTSVEKAKLGTLATVATSGNYTDLANKPIIPVVPTLATVATSGSYTDLTNKPIAAGLPVLATVATTGSYTDLINKPAAPTLATVATTGNYADLLSKPVIPVLPTLAVVATSGSYTDLTSKPTIPVLPTLATVATTGSYTDLTSKPVIPVLPVLATVATSGSYTDLTSKPVIPAAYTDAQAVAANATSITANTTAINNEATARAAADTALQGQATTNATNIASNVTAIGALSKRTRATLGIYEPLFQSTSGLANPSGTFAVAAGGGLTASVAGTNASGTMSLPKIIDNTLPFRFAALVEFQPGAGTLEVNFNNSANGRSQVDFTMSATGLSMNVGYGGTFASLIGGLVAGARFWFTITGDGTQIYINLMPLARQAFTRTPTFQGTTQADYALAYPIAYTEGGNSTFVGLNQVVLTNSSATSKIVGVWCSQESGFGGPVDGRLRPPTIMLPQILTDTTPIVRIPKTYTGNGATDLILWMHPNNTAEAQDAMAGDPDAGASNAYLVEQGYIVAMNLGAPAAAALNSAEASNWGAYRGLKYRYALVKWCLDNLPGIRNVYTVGLSMGCLNGLGLHRTYPGLVRAHVGISGVTNMSYSYNLEGFGATVNTAYTVTAITQVQDQDPNLRPEVFANLPMKLWHGTADTLISKVNHPDLFKTNVELVGGSVTVVPVIGAGHLNQAALFDGPSIVAFFQANI